MWLCVQPEEDEGRGRLLGPVGINILLLLLLALFFGFLFKIQKLLDRNKLFHKSNIVPNVLV
jgi:hypothetical protein